MSEHSDPKAARTRVLFPTGVLDRVF